MHPITEIHNVGGSRSKKHFLGKAIYPPLQWSRICYWKLLYPAVEPRGELVQSTLFATASPPNLEIAHTHTD